MTTNPYLIVPLFTITLAMFGLYPLDGSPGFLLVAIFLSCFYILGTLLLETALKNGKTAHAKDVWSRMSVDAENIGKRNDVLICTFLGLASLVAPGAEIANFMFAFGMIYCCVVHFVYFSDKYDDDFQSPDGFA